MVRNEHKGFRTDSEVPINIEGLGFQGTVTTTYDVLEEVFGEPRGGDGEKVTCEWRIEFDDGTIATIYDWMQDRTPYSDYEWHIGGFDEAAVQAVHNAIEQHALEGDNDFFS